VLPKLLTTNLAAVDPQGSFSTSLALWGGSARGKVARPRHVANGGQAGVKAAGQWDNGFVPAVGATIALETLRCAAINFCYGPNGSPAPDKGESRRVRPTLGSPTPSRAGPARSISRGDDLLEFHARGRKTCDHSLSLIVSETLKNLSHASCQHSGRFYDITRAIISQPLETPHCLEQILSDESHVCLAKGRMSRLLLHPGQASAHLGNAEDPHLFSRDSRHLRWLGQQLADDGVVAGRRPAILTPLEHGPTIRPPDFAFTLAFRRGTRSAWDRRGSGCPTTSARGNTDRPRLPTT